ncbi:MAG TPA: hypothetical protein VMZ90_04760 [Vicinamibacterales bacterium]|nr:hypothetical protein [Vicinamibacterales bacterium]
MTRRHVVFILAALALVATLVTVGLTIRESREERRTIAALQSDMVRLTGERDRLQAEIVGAVGLDRRLTGGPDKPLRIGIPTTLARTLVSTLVDGVVDQVSLSLGNLRVQKKGEIRRVVTLGNFDLTVRVKQIDAKLGAGAPDLQFGANQMRMVMPVRLESGAGSAEIDFHWYAQGISGAVCGDMSVLQVVTGTVTPSVYRLAGTLQLSTTRDAIVVTPRMPALHIQVRVVPSKASWALVQKTLDAKTGLCGFVIDRVNIPGALEELLAKGFSIRLPIEKVRPVAVPIGFAETVMVQGTPVQIGVKADGLQITSDMIWLGADVTLATPPVAVPAPRVPISLRR